MALGVAVVTPTRRRTEETRALRDAMRANRKAAAGMADELLDRAVDLGPAMQARASRLDSTEGKSTGSASRGIEVLARRMMVECRLDQLQVDRRITDAEWEAGMKLQRDWGACKLRFSVVAAYGETRGRGGTADTAAVATHRMSAHERVSDIMRTFPMQESAAILAVCGEDETPHTPKGRMGYLKAGLARLVKFYRIDPGFQRFVKR